MSSNNKSSLGEFMKELMYGRLPKEHFPDQAESVKQTEKQKNTAANPVKAPDAVKIKPVTPWTQK